MFKWILTLIIAIFLLGFLAPHIARFIRFGRLPGDFSLRWRGQRYVFPVVSTVLMSLLLYVISRVI